MDIKTTPGPFPTGRLPAVDFRDHDHLLASRLTPRQLTHPTRTQHEWSWPPNIPPLDQGNTPACTGFSALGLLIAGPVYQKRSLQLPTGLELYSLAQKNDEFPGEDYEGSSVRGAMKGLQGLGFLSGYEWAFQLEVAVAWILYHGPLVFGTLWPDSLFYPKPHAHFGTPCQVITIDRSQKPQGGGHAYLVRAANTRFVNPDGSRGAFLIHNSWGESWGDPRFKGEAWISFQDMDVLLKEDGEACTPLEVRKTA